MPRSSASLLIDSVSAMRNGFTSFSGDENPTTASFMLRSGGLTLQTSPLACATSCWAFSPPPPEPCPSVCAPGGAHAANITSAASNPTINKPLIRTSTTPFLPSHYLVQSVRGFRPPPPRASRVKASPPPGHILLSACSTPSPPSRGPP